ncbi:MAG: RNA polymerase sigma factor [Phycisphaerales bacterium]
MPLDDRQLLLGIARGRDDCARELWSRHGTILSALARAIVGESASGDVVQSALCRILQSSTLQLRAIESVPAWLATLVRYEAANYLRSERRRRSRDRDHHESSCHQPALSLGAVPDVDSLWPRVDSLPRRLREVIVLKLVAGMTFDQLALALGLNRNTAAARYRCAMDYLRQSIGSEIQPVSPGDIANAP